MANTQLLIGIGSGSEIESVCICYTIAVGGLLVVHEWYALVGLSKRSHECATK